MLSFPAGWWVVSVATVGPVAAFLQEQEALDHANALRDIVGEARGLTSAFSVRQVPVPAELPEHGPPGTASKHDLLGDIFFLPTEK